MIVIIFGSSGQDGFYLTDMLQQKGYDVIGVSRKQENGNTDITIYDSVAELIKNNLPKYIFHFAANSTTRHDALFENHETISTGTLNILESVRKYVPVCKVFITGSGVLFRNMGLPIKETDEFQANNAYAVARIQSVYAARYFRDLGIK